MKFSVLLSIYYKESVDNLCQCLDSILLQSIMPDEIVLVKDGPLTKELDDAILRYQLMLPNLKIVPLCKNVGLGNALNEGLKFCTNDLVARMDTDDICKIDRFERQVSIFNNNPDVDVVSAWIEEFDTCVDNVISVRKLPENHKDIYEYGKSRCPVNHPVVMFRKSAVIAAGGYLHVPLFEDYYLWVRMLLSGSKFYNIPESLLFFRASDGMFMRRGGIQYAFTEMSFLWHIYKLGYVSFITTIKNMLIRFTVRLSPNSLRRWIYKNLLR